MKKQKHIGILVLLPFFTFVIPTTVFAEQVTSVSAEALSPTVSTDSQPAPAEEPQPLVGETNLPPSLEPVSAIGEPVPEEPETTVATSIPTPKSDLKDAEFYKQLQEALNPKPWDNESIKNIDETHYPQPGDKIDVKTVTKIPQFKDITIFDKGVLKTIKVPDGNIEVPEMLKGTVLTSEFIKGNDKAGTVVMTLDINGDKMADAQVKLILDGKGKVEIDSNPIKK